MEIVLGQGRGSEAKKIFEKQIFFEQVALLLYPI
jgi:hypothetical protein